jgi:hypothetical protein
MCKNVSGPPSSPLMNPKARSAFLVIYRQASYFPFFSPDLDQATDGGLWFRWNVILFAAGAKHSFSANYLDQSFVCTESSLYSISKPRLVFSIGHFAFPLANFTSGIHLPPFVFSQARFSASFARLLGALGRCPDRGAVLGIAGFRVHGPMIGPNLVHGKPLGFGAQAARSTTW